MPISPMNMVLYPGGSIKSPEWLAIRSYIRARAGDCCEQCGVRHLTYGVRMDGEFTDLGLDKAEALGEYEYAKGIATIFSGPDADLSAIPPMIRIVCTVAHMDHGLTDHSTANLKFLCQKHHNGHDAPNRAATARRTIAAKAGQGALL
jgi:hypothetical protein